MSDPRLVDTLQHYLFKVPTPILTLPKYEKGLEYRHKVFCFYFYGEFRSFDLSCDLAYLPDYLTFHFVIQHLRETLEEFQGDCKAINEELSRIKFNKTQFNGRTFDHW